MRKTKINQNIAGFTSNSQYAKLGRNKTINMYVESSKVEERGVNRVLYGLGGFKSWKNITGKCRGMHVCKNSYDGKPVLFAVFGYHLYSIDTNGNITDKGIVSAGNSKFRFAEVPVFGGGDSFLVMVDGSTMFAINSTNDNGTIVNVSLPMRSSNNTRIEPNSVVHLYGHLVVNDSKTDAFYTSCTHPFFTSEGVTDFDPFMVNDPESSVYQYGYVNYNEYRGDKTQVLISNGNNMWAFGTDSIQRWSKNNVEISKLSVLGDVWSCPNSSCSNIGCCDANSVAQLNDNIFWVGNGMNGCRQVYAMNAGGSIASISTPEIEREIAEASKFDAFTFMLKGHPFYVLTFDDTTYAYDLRENGWINLCSNVNHKFRYVNSIQFGNKLLFGTDGQLNEYTDDDHTDCGSPILRSRCGMIDAGDDIILNEVKPIMNTGDGTCNLRMNYSNDGKTFKQFTIECGGNLGDYSYEPVFFDLGEGSVFNIELSTTSNTPFVIKDCEIVFEECIY